jgi:UDP-N-acetylmuramate dehydrogenase
MTTLGVYTTLGVGGPARELLIMDHREQFLAAVRDFPENGGTPPLIIGHGSNVVVSDTGYPGLVLVDRTCGLALRPVGPAQVDLAIASGEPLDGIVRLAVEQGLSGIECLAGIPGTVGATPAQNVGAYGQEISQVLVAVDVWDRRAGTTRRITHGDCQFGYRDSRFKRSPLRFTVLTVHIRLTRSPLSQPIRYQQVAAELGVGLGTRVPLRAAMEAVLAVRRRKGMVVDAGDPESRSAGSFFLNPVIDERAWSELCHRAGAGTTDRPPRLVSSDGMLRTSAGWLIERAGFTRGQRLGSVRISRKHTLALVAEDSTTALDVRRGADTIRGRVGELFGVWLEPEPLFVGPFPGCRKEVG